MLHAEAVTRLYRLSYNKYNGSYSLTKGDKGVYRLVKSGVAFGTSNLCALILLHSLNPRNTLCVGDMPRHTLSLLREISLDMRGYSKDGRVW